jgi:hypothetical protein
VLPNGNFSSLVIPLAVSGIRSNCFLSIKEVDTRSGGRVVPVLEAPPYVAVAPPAAQRTTTNQLERRDCRAEKDYKVCRRYVAEANYDYWNNAGPPDNYDNRLYDTSLSPSILKLIL